MQCTRIYFKRLMESMGENVKFAIDEVCQDAGRTAAVMWHLGKITASLNYRVIGKSGRTMMPSYCLVQNGMDTSSPLPRAAASTYVQQMERCILSGSWDQPLCISAKLLELWYCWLWYVQFALSNEKVNVLPFTWDSNDSTYTAGKFTSSMSHHWSQESGHW